MKETIEIVCRDRVAWSDVAAFILGHGGWTDEERSRFGGVQAGEGVVWFYFDEAETERDAAMESVGEQILERFGGPYGSSVTLEGSSHDASAALLTDLAIACCEDWAPAFVHDWMGSLLSLDEVVRLRAEGRTLRDLSNEKMEGDDFGLPQ